MSKHVSGPNISAAWVAAFSALAEAKGAEIVNLTVTIDDPGREVLGVRQAIDLEVARLGKTPKGAEFNKSIHTVANTIFPIGLYRAGRPDAFYETARAGQDSRDGTVTSWGPKSGTYAGRLLRYPTYGRGEFNQLKRILEYLDDEKTYRDRYEISLTCECPEVDPDNPTLATSASTFLPDYDGATRGGQCLSHLSLNVTGGRLSMAALYRHQTYVSRAYGNFLGLARLMHFLARETSKDLQVGELMVVASHAGIEAAAASIKPNLLEACADRLAEEPVPIEWQARPFGSSWADLELPKVAQ